MSVLYDNVQMDQQPTRNTKVLKIDAVTIMKAMTK